MFYSDSHYIIIRGASTNYGRFVRNFCNLLSSKGKSAPVLWTMFTVVCVLQPFQQFSSILPFPPLSLSSSLRSQFGIPPSKHPPKFLGLPPPLSSPGHQSVIIFFALFRISCYNMSQPTESLWFYMYLTMSSPPISAIISNCLCISHIPGFRSTCHHRFYQDFIPFYFTFLANQFVLQIQFICIIGSVTYVALLCLSLFPCRYRKQVMYLFKLHSMFV